MGRPSLSPPLFDQSGKRLYGRNTEATCQHCGNVFRVRVSTLKEGGGRFCSKRCNAKARPDTFGAKAHRWTKEEAAIVSRLGGLASARVRHRNPVPYHHRHPDRVRAHRVVNYWLRKGRLVKTPCADCGTTNRLHAHHEDYSKPLDVIWLCAFCHYARHHARQERAS
jgi:hypothetical protein